MLGYVEKLIFDSFFKNKFYVGTYFTFLKGFMLKHNLYQEFF